MFASSVRTELSLLRDLVTLRRAATVKAFKALKKARAARPIAPLKTPAAAA
ncbi:MAG: hypothetical protein JSR47_25080 [Proteobacteria bacterium]|nr:hypothetical protein [Pseudomonadota bacterium]